MKRCNVSLKFCFDSSLQKHVRPASFYVQHKHAGPVAPSSCCNAICRMQGDSWQLAAKLHKLELIHGVLASGYSAVYVELDTVFFRNPMQHLLSLQVCHHPSPGSLIFRLLLNPEPQPAQPIIKAAWRERRSGRLVCVHYSCTNLGMATSCN